LLPSSATRPTSSPPTPRPSSALARTALAVPPVLLRKSAMVRKSGALPPQHPERHVLTQPLLDLPCAVYPTQYRRPTPWSSCRDRRAADPARPSHTRRRFRKIQFVDHLADEVRQVLLGQPILQAGGIRGVALAVRLVSLRHASLCHISNMNSRKIRNSRTRS